MNVAIRYFPDFAEGAGPGLPADALPLKTGGGMLRGFSKRGHINW